MKRLLLISFIGGIYGLTLQAQTYRWKNVEIGGGGFVSGIITSPTCKNLMYARTDVGGAYRWNASDKTWIPLNEDLTSDQWSWQGIESLAIDPTDSNKVYIAAGMYTNGWSSAKAVVMRSSDKGATWARSQLTFHCGGNEPGRSNGERLAVDPNKPSILFLGSRRDGLWKSVDGAVTWSKVVSFPVYTVTGDWRAGITFVVFDKSSGTTGKATPTLYAGIGEIGSNNLYMSTDSGTTWSAVPNQPTTLMPSHLVMDDDSMLYLSYGNTWGPNDITSGALYKYNKLVQKWTNISPISGSFGWGGISIDRQNQQTLVASTIDRWASGDDVYRSTNAGKSWKSVMNWKSNSSILKSNGMIWWQSQLTPHWMGDIEIDPFDSNHALFVTGFGIFSCYNLVSADSSKTTPWYFENKGLEESVPQDIVSPSSGAHLLSVIGDFDGFRHDSVDYSPATGRFYPFMGTSTGIECSEINPNIVARVGGSGGYGYYSTNGGISWTAFKARPTSGSASGSVAVSAKGTTIIWTPSGLASYYTTNNGNSWTSCSKSQVNTRVYADKAADNIFYSYLSGNGSFYVSKNGGASFVLTYTLPSWGGRMATVPSHGGHIFVPISGSGLYFSGDTAKTFTKLPNVTSASAVAVGKAAPGKNYPSIFIQGTVSSVTGFFRSDDRGATWNRINTDKQNFGGVNDIEADQRIWGRLYIGSSGRGIVYGQPLYDCHGDSAGQAFYDYCDSCVGGNTGKLPCAQPGFDCAGVLGGIATLDKCGICVGGVTGKDSCKQDCTGTYGGKATLDSCQICVGGSTGLDSCVRDCAGVLGGSATLDSCKICSGGNTGITPCVVAVQEQTQKVLVTPNPFIDKFVISMAGKFTYTIYTPNGIAVQKGEESKSGEYGYNLPSGLYILAIKSQSINYIYKLLKL
jgi:photosystem II stability/assembly factor-like uncharacterized protein